MDTIGFGVQTTVPAASFVSAGGYHHYIGANTWHHRTTPSDGRGLSWFEVVVPEPSVLEAVRERLAVREILVLEMDDGIEVTDSDGIEVRLRVESTN